MLTRRNITLSVVLTGEEPPTEFRIFTAGQVETTKGTFLFDADAATSVMAEYAKHGIDLMIDYDHYSLAAVSLDPATAGKAAGWFNLEVRNGELWAVNVRWTPPAAEALRRKEWRFMSPAFETVEGRVVSLMNVAITNLPATRRLQPLMAASSHALSGAGMDPKKIAEALDALIAGDDAKCAELLKGIIAEAAGAEATEEPVEEAPAVEPAPEAMAEGAAAPVDPKKEKPAEVAASVSMMMRLSDSKSFSELLSKFELYRASHIELETERQKLAKERATLEAAERRRGCVDLVVQAGRAPATVWASDKADAPKSYLASMLIADFREYVADAIKANAGKTAIKPPTGKLSVKAPESGAVDALGLTATDRQYCKDAGCDPKTYAAIKARTT